MQKHELKIKPEYFKKIRNGTKTAEIRVDDRNFMPGDLMILKEWKSRKKVFTGYECPCRITDVFRLYHIVDGIDPDWVMLSFDLVCE